MTGEPSPREDGERLVAYLVGDLGSDDRQELEDRLSRDPALRARLDAIRRVDEGLSSLGEVGPRPAFSARLRDELRPVVREEITTGDTDELAARRRQRSGGTPRWLAPLGAAAAALALFTAVGVGLSSMGGTDDSDEGVETTALDTMEAGDSVADQPGPVVVALGRSYTTDDVLDVTDDPAFEEVLGLGPEAAEPVSRSYSSAFGVGDGDDSAVAEEHAEGDAAPEAQSDEQGAPPAALHVRGEVSEDDLAAARRCLPQLFEAAATVVPVYAEIAEFEGEAAIVYGLVSEDGDSGGLQRIEVWVVARDGCEVRYFTQQDR